jgi:asparagine synthase (glutamine-hydrolysing)
VNGVLKDMIVDYLTNNSYSSNFVDAKFIKNLLDDKIDISQEKRAKILWVLFSLEAWHR